MERDFKAARKFAVKWATKSHGEIANLGGCYLQVEQERDRLRAIATEAIEHFGYLAEGDPMQEEHAEGLRAALGVK
jgi:hypothetical protein